MKSITVPSRAKTLNDLLKKAQRREIILRSEDGRHFLLACVEGWEGFEVGEDDDVTRNRKLMKHLSNRRCGGKKISLQDVKAQLDL